MPLDPNPAVLRADAMLTPAGPVSDAELEIDADGRITYAGPARAGSTTVR